MEARRAASAMRYSAFFGIEANRLLQPGQALVELALGHQGVALVEGARSGAAGEHHQDGQQVQMQLHHHSSDSPPPTSRVWVWFSGR